MATLCLRVILLFLKYYSEESYLTLCVYVHVPACTLMTLHTGGDQGRLESVLSSQVGFKDQTQVVRLGSKGLYLLSISQPQLIICLALASNSTQTVSVVQIFQNIHKLFYLRGKISPSFPICFI